MRGTDRHLALPLHTASVRTVTKPCEPAAQTTLKTSHHHRFHVSLEPTTSRDPATIIPSFPRDFCSRQCGLGTSQPGGQGSHCPRAPHGGPAPSLTQGSTSADVRALCRLLPTRGPENMLLSHGECHHPAPPCTRPSALSQGARPFLREGLPGRSEKARFSPRTLSPGPKETLLGTATHTSDPHRAHAVT